MVARRPRLIGRGKQERWIPEYSYDEGLERSILGLHAAARKELHQDDDSGGSSVLERVYVDISLDRV